jgi:phosphatidylglycerophosphate synthase
MVTVLGLVFQLFGIILIIFYDLSLSKPLPEWIYVIFALCLFVYQTLDAIDGKHARNTNRSSAVGQLMDHGCDAFSNSFMVIFLAQAHRLGGNLDTIVVQCLVQLTFYVIQWQEYHTGILLTHMHNMGVTEFQFIAIIVIMIPVFLGNISERRIFNDFISIREILVYVNAI